MRTIRPLARFAAMLILAAPSGALAEALPRLDVTILTVGSWRPDDPLRVRVIARDAEPARLEGRSVALRINGATVGAKPLAARTPSGAPYADFTAPWQGNVQTAFSAEWVDAPQGAVAPDEDAAGVVQPD